MRLRLVLAFGAVTFLAMNLQADILKLKSGAAVQGTLNGNNGYPR